MADLKIINLGLVTNYNQIPFYLVEVIFNKIGGIDKVVDVIRDEYDVVLVERIKKFFDKNGRIIPRDLQAKVCDASKNFCLKRPAVNLPKLITNWEIAFEQKFPISLDELENRAVAILDLLKNNPLLSNCLNGSWVVTLVPKMTVDDYGTILERVFLPAAERGYKAAYPDRTFVTYRSGTLPNPVKVISGTRHEVLIDKMSKDNVVLVHFVNPTQGFSVNAQREVISSLPTDFILSGPIDRLTALTTYPTIMARDCTLGYDCSAVFLNSGLQSLYFTADDYKIQFLVLSGDHGEAYGDYSGGLSVLG